MNTLALIAFALWALFMRFLPRIFVLLKLKQWAKTVPGPSIGEFLENNKNYQLLDWFTELRKKHGSTFRVWMGKDLMVYFSDPEDVKQLLTNNTLLYKSDSYQVLHPWLGNSLLNNGGELWHSRRKMLTPAFHFRILSQFKEPMEENCKILVRNLKQKVNGDDFDIYPYITFFALDVICETAMGIKKNYQMQNESEYVKAVEVVCRTLHKRSISFWQRFDVLYKYTQDGRATEEALKILHGESNHVINLRRKLLQDSDIHSMTDAEKSIDDIGSKRRLAFLDMLLISQMEGVPLTDREIREEVDNFMFGGHDTSSSAISFAIYLLSQHADEQQLAYEEAVAMEGREKEPMPYLEAVIKESLRLYPSVPFFSRLVKEDLQVGNLTVPKGANISVPTYLIHRDEKEYPEPGKFKPERFLHKDKEMHPFSFVAFSAGPRNCIGQKFAMLELKCVLSYLLRKFELLPAKGFEPILLPELIMKSGNGIRLRIKERK